MKKDQVKSEVEVLHLFRWFTHTHTHATLSHTTFSHTHTQTLLHATLSYGIRTSFSQSAFHHLHRTHTYFLKYIVTTLSHTHNLLTQNSLTRSVFHHLLPLSCLYHPVFTFLLLLIGSWHVGLFGPWIFALPSRSGFAAAVSAASARSSFVFCNSVRSLWSGYVQVSLLLRLHAYY